MKMKKLLMVMMTAMVVGAQAVIITSADQSDFTLVAEPLTYTDVGTFANISSLSGNLTLDAASGIGNPATTSQFYFDFADSMLSGNIYALSGDENFDVLFSSAQTAFAFTYEDDSFASTFTLNFYDDAVLVGSTAFLTSSFNTEQFIGFSSDTEFNKITVREEDGVANSNEYFQFYSAEAIPEPSTLAFIGVFGGGMFLARRRFRS